MTDYAEQTVEELRKQASSRQISGRAEMNKEELVTALQMEDSAEDRVGDLERRVVRLEKIVMGNLPSNSIPPTR